MTHAYETYVGGKCRKHGKDAKTGKGSQGRSLKKTPVFSMVSGVKAYAQVVPNAKAKTLLPIINELVKKGSTVITDSLASYNQLSKDYIHKVIPHSEKIYAVDGFWSHIKRSIYQSIVKNSFFVTTPVN